MEAFIKRKIWILLFCFFISFFNACTVSKKAEQVPAETKTSPVTASSAQAAEAVLEVAGIFYVAESDTLERDIIPQLCRLFSLTEEEVKESLAAPVESELIHASLDDFRRMEGILVPGTYLVYAGQSLSDYVEIWIRAAEDRYQTLLSGSESRNDLLPYEQLALASMVEWECLANEYKEEVATIFLNRLEEGAKLQSCVTAEYALSYQRPYLTSEDVAIQSEYNTYVCEGLPVGPLCVVDDESLLAAVGRGMDSDMYYFFYDYVADEMQFFSDYTAFRAACKVSKQMFMDTLDMDPYAIVNKQELFGQGAMG